MHIQVIFTPIMWYNYPIKKNNLSEAENTMTNNNTDKDKTLKQREQIPNEYKWDIEEYQPSDNEEGFKLVTIGEYTQIPLKIAFAITIHKSQGQTFKNVIIHPESWSNGQLYVALSRCTDEEGLKLAYPIKERYLRANEDVINFYYKDEYYKEQEEVRKLARFSELKNISEGIDKIDIDGVVDEIPDKYKDKVNKLILILQELEESA